MWNTFRIPYQISYDCDRKYGYKEPVHTDYFNSVKFLTFIFTFALYLYTTIPNSQSSDLSQTAIQCNLVTYLYLSSRKYNNIC